MLRFDAAKLIFVFMSVPEKESIFLFVTAKTWKQIKLILRKSK
jgi:hypothetical protein